MMKGVACAEYSHWRGGDAPSDYGYHGSTLGAGDACAPVNFGKQSTSAS